MEWGGLSLLLFIVVYVHHTWTHSSTGQSRENFYVAWNQSLFKKGDKLHLVCSSKEIPSKMLIRKRNTGRLLNESHTRNLSLDLLIQAMTCQDLGDYECIIDSDEPIILHVLLYDCYPIFCDGEDANTTIYVPVNQTFNFTFCVLFYSGMMDKIKFNGTFISKTETQQRGWTWANKTSPFSPGEIKRTNVTVKQVGMSDKEYGLLTIKVFGTTGTQYGLEYRIFILEPGPPDCPKEVQVTGQGLDYIALSWKPGSNRGAEQSFYVYVSTDTVPWRKLGVITGGEISASVTDTEPWRIVGVTTGDDISASITRLSENTTYRFRIVSVNKYNIIVDASVCENTIVSRTLIASDKHDFTPYIIAVPVGFMVLLVLILATVLGCYTMRRRRHARDYSSDIYSRIHHNLLMCVPHDRKENQVQFLTEGNEYSEASYRKRSSVPLEEPPPIPTNRPPPLPFRSFSSVRYDKATTVFCASHSGTTATITCTTTTASR